MNRRLPLFGLALTVVVLAAPARAVEPGDDQFPNSILAPEIGSAHSVLRRPRHGAHGRVKQATRPARPSFAVRGSSGSVLPTPLPRTSLIPPENHFAPISRAPPQEQGPTVVPGAPGLGAVPNLPHGPETFQDRASRCAFQQGLANVPAGASTQYMGACVQ